MAGFRSNCLRSIKIDYIDIIFGISIPIDFTLCRTNITSAVAIKSKNLVISKVTNRHDNNNKLPQQKAEAWISASTPAE